MIEIIAGDGRACPKCGAIGEVVGRQPLTRAEHARLRVALCPARAGATVEIVERECVACRHSWSHLAYCRAAAAAGAVVCPNPKCNSPSVRVTSSPRKRVGGLRVRQYICLRCRRRFKKASRE